ncbi:MAG: hypothetical protein CMD87_05725 [Gammaproteobacteria bacterium]|nr:hypothetical protein [Gammaproteobacteria bacterium]|tara:strand:+ start:1209 stop:1463 length:255 start_codon:yes stop_codon:yes gene_type:complete
MRELPLKYMMKSHKKRVEMHREILMALENISSNSLQNIYRQLQNVEAKRMLIRELLISMTEGTDLSTSLIQIDNIIGRDAQYEE